MEWANSIGICRAWRSDGFWRIPADSLEQDLDQLERVPSGADPVARDGAELYQSDWATGGSGQAFEIDTLRKMGGGD